MLNPEIFSISLEIFIEFIANHQKLSETNRFMERISNAYDKYFHSTHFSTLYKNKVEFYHNQVNNENESLFIMEYHIPYLIRSKVLIESRDKLLVYITIQNWIALYDIPHHSLYKKLATTLGIEKTVSEEIDLLFSARINLQNNKNYLFFTPHANNKYEKLEGEWIDYNKPETISGEELIISEKIASPFHALFIEEEKLFLIVQEEGNRFSSNKQNIPDNNLCILERGMTIPILENEELSFAELKKKLIEKQFRNKLVLCASEVKFHSPSQNNITELNLLSRPGELIGVAGLESSGKSSILKLLSGNIAPKSGSIFINGYDIHKNPYLSREIIGYVPEQDLLYPELTVFDNLYLAAQLYSKKSNAKLLVEQILKDVGLYEIRESKVGKKATKRIQPGQRRLLNIALELIRDPQILIIDNAVSALSQNDSSLVVNFLNKYSFKGKLIITAITQTDDETFKSFDQLLVLAHEGTPIYIGPGLNAVPYLKSFLPEGIRRSYESKNSFSSGTLLDLIQKKDENGRNYLPVSTLQEKLAKKPIADVTRPQSKKKLPVQHYAPPRLEKQFLVYFIRNFKSQLSRRRELTFSLFASPLIALLISLVLRSSNNDTSYQYRENPNLPVFLFVSIIIFIFIGLAQSVKEILREKFVLTKEEKLTLSLFSYINSKVSYLFIIILIQSLFYTLITNAILEIHGTFIYQWVIYFSCGANGTLIGLIFSSTHKSFSSIIMRSVPVIIILYTLLGGGWIPTQNVNSTTNRSTSVSSNLCISRWAYEAIMVQQFLKNPYEKHFFHVDRIISNSAFHSYHLLPRLRKNLEEAKGLIHYPVNIQPDTLDRKLNMIKKKFEVISTTENIFAFEFLESLNAKKFTPLIASEANEYISYLDFHFYKEYNSATKKKSIINDSLEIALGINDLEKLKNKYINNQIIKTVRNASQRESIKNIDDELTQLSDPIFQKADNNIGRGPMFSSEKRFNNQVIRTFEFNLSIIWVFNFILYIFLITNLINRIFKTPL